jgi:hypothetical protein
MRSSKSLLLFFGALLALTAGFAATSAARVDVNVGINVPLPPFVIPAPPPVVVIPNSYVYYVPDVDVDILFYHGYWYRPYQGQWFRARSYNGPWAHLPPHRVPPALVSLPPNWHMPPGHQRIPHGQLKKNWNRWERERYWQHRGWGNEGYGPGPGGHPGGKGPEGRGFEDGRGPDRRDFDDRGGPGGHGHGHGR